MINALKILHKVLVTHFYSVNTGFFLFVFFVLFGMPQNVKEFHLSLIDAIIKNSSILALVMVAWVLYNTKCMDYTLKQLRLPKQNFLFSLHSLRYVTLFFYMVYIQLMIYLPVFIYALFVIVIAIQKGYIACAIEIILFTAVVTGLTPLLYVRVLQRKPLMQGLPQLPRLTAKMGKPLFSLPLYNIWNNRKQMLLVSKTFSLLMLYAFIKMYLPDHYDIRPTLLCVMLAAAVNCAIVFEMKLFEDVFLQMQRNFPLSILQRFGNAAFSFFLLMLPELLFIWKGYPLYFCLADFTQLLLFAVGLPLLFYACLFTDDTNMDSYLRIVFGILAGLFFIILYNPGIVLGIAITLMAFGLYASYYYSFEKKHR